MELIEALERLSVSVRSGQDTTNVHREFTLHNGIDSNQVQGLTNDLGLPNEVFRTNQDVLVEQQMEEFKNSVDTLLLQLNDLEKPPSANIDVGTNVGANHHNIKHHNNQRRASLDTYNRPPAFSSCSSHLGGSVETSQEEDSDNSSQRSFGRTTSLNGWQNSSRHHSTNQLVSNLLQKDLSTITDTLRKIGRILALGKEMESIYKILESPSNVHGQLPDCHYYYTQPQNISSAYIQTLCKTFTDLCSTEPFVCDLPTIVRYDSISKQLIANLSHHTNTTPAYRYQPGGSSHVNEDMMSIPEELMCLDRTEEEIDCAILECEQQSLRFNSWTENKLYVDQRSGTNDN